ncbi:hypothetical protein ACO0K0_07160 [Undibacterium sp. SXout11W]|uniref:hypothetical protein n=1 Tax=Undibacterium sp. SXout11W TaxID=3413050 RepID=UPI003BEFAE1C
MATAGQKSKGAGRVADTPDVKQDPNATTTYTALVVINHNDDLYDVGDSINLTDKEAAQLLVCNAIALPDDKAAE